MLAVNPAASERLGYTHAELMAMRDGAVDAPEHAVHAAERMAGILAFGSATFETVHVSRDGTLVPTEVNARRITWEGKDAIIATCRDITWRKRAEDDKARLQAQLEQAQKLESIGRLAGGVAHDFNNMLEVILGHAELALEQLDGAHPLRADLDAIRVAAGRSADLTRQLLAFARRQMVTPRVIDLNATVADTLRLLQRLIGVDIVLDWKPGVDLWPVRMDPSQVDQILANLCVNARDAIAGHGRIAIETRTATVGPEAGPEREPGEYVVLSVADDGCGMDDTTRSHIFEPFYTTKPLGKGTGLGLATVYGAVMQNRGFIDVHSAPGRGSTFTIYLPRHVERAGLDVAGEPTPDPAAAGGTVLLVEDEPALLELTNRILRTRGYTVLAAATADDAMRIARQQGAAIRLLITDIFMPGINGRELADRLRHLAPGLKVLFTSGHPADSVGPQLTAGDGAQFLQKPFTVQALAAKVREALA
jgi:PAS domain S-box-containing protein